MRETDVDPVDADLPVEIRWNVLKVGEKGDAAFQLPELVSLDRPESTVVQRTDERILFKTFFEVECLKAPYTPAEART